MNDIDFFHECTPPTATMQHGRPTRDGRYYQTPQAAKAKATYRAIFEQYAPSQPLGGIIAVSIVWTFPLPKAHKDKGSVRWKATRPDLDNLAKIAIDSLVVCGYMIDDNQIAQLKLAKMEGPITGIAIKIRPCETNNNRGIAQ